MQCFILITAVPSLASVPDVYTTSEVETEAITVSATPSSCVHYTQTDDKTVPQIITVSHTLTNESSNQCLESERSNMMWIVLAILSLVMAISTIVFSIIIGCIFQKKINNMKNSSTYTATSSNDTNEPVKEGTVSHNN